MFVDAHKLRQEFQPKMSAESADIRTIALVGGTPDSSGKLNYFDQISCDVAIGRLIEKGIILHPDFTVTAHTVDPVHYDHSKGADDLLAPGNNVNADLFVFLMVPSSHLAHLWNDLIQQGRTNHSYSSHDHARDSWHNRLLRSDAKAIVTIGGPHEISSENFLGISGNHYQMLTNASGRGNLIVRSEWWQKKQQIQNAPDGSDHQELNI